MAAQLPAVVVVGDAKVSQPLAAALDKTQHFDGSYPVFSAMHLTEITASLPDGRLVYLLSPTAEMDLEGVTLADIAEQIQGQGHYVMAVGGDPAGEQFAQQTGLPVLRPQTSLVKSIAPVCGVEIAPAGPATPVAPPAPADPPVQEKGDAAADVKRTMAWRRAKEAAEEGKSRELAPRPESKQLWQNAVDTSRREGTLQPGHRARRGYVISFAVRKGGVGKTSLSVNSAAYLGRKLAAAGRRVVLVDMNLQQSDVGNYIHQHSPNVHDIVRNPNLLTLDQIEDALVYSEKHQFHALLGPTSLMDADPGTLHPDLYKQILDLLRKRFDYILVDTPVGEFYHGMLRMVLPESNFIIVPVQPARVTLSDVAEWLKRITAPRHTNGYGVDSRKVGLVLNRAKLGIGLDPPDVEDRLPGWKFIGMIPDSDEWQLAENTGGLVGANPPDELDEVFNHMLYEATHDNALKSVRGNKGSSKRGQSNKGVGGKFGRLIKRLISA